MPAVHPQTGLECVVGRTCPGFFLVDVEEIGESGPRHVEIHPIRAVEAADRTVGRGESKALPPWGRRGIKSGDLGLAGLVDVAETEKFGSLRTHVSDLEDRLAQLLLHIEIPILRVRGANVRVGAKEITQRGEPGEYRRTRGDRTSRQCRRADRGRTDSGKRRSRTKRAVIGYVPEEDILRKRVVEQAPAAAKYGPSLAARVIREAEARRKIVVILVVQLVGRNHTVTSLVQLIKKMVLLAHYSEVVPAHAEVHGEAWGQAEAVLNIEAMVVFKGMAPGVALGLLAAAGNALQKSFQRRQSVRPAERVGDAVETEPTTERIVLDQLDRRSAELVSKLHVVTAGLPRIVVNEVPIGIHSRLGNRIGRANRRIAPHRDVRQTEVERRGHARIQPDRRRIEVLVLGKEAFHKTVPAQPRLVDLVGVDHFYIRKRNQLDPCWSDRVETGQKAAGQLRKWETLVAVPEIVAAGQQIVGIEVVVNLRNQAIHAVLEAGGDGEIVNTASALVAHPAWDIRRRPRISGQQRRHDRAHGFTPGRDIGLGSRNHGRIGHAALARLRSRLALSLVIHIEEGMVFENWAAQRTAKLIVVERVLRTLRVEEVSSSANRAGAVVLERRTVQSIGAALGHDIDHGTAVATVFRFIVRKHPQLSHGINRQDGGRIAKDTRFIDRGIVAIAVVHIRTVKQEVIGPSARSIHGESSERSRRVADLVRGAGHAGIQVDQLGVIASIYRHVRNGFGGQGTAQLCGRGLYLG